MQNKSTNNEVKASASALGKLSAQRRLGHLNEQERSEWGRRLGQIWREHKAADSINRATK